MLDFTQMARDKAEIKRKLLTMPTELHDEFVRLAERHDRSVEAEMRMALRTYAREQKAAA